MLFTYGYLFYVPVTMIFVAWLGIQGIVKKRPLAYYIIALIFIIYINMVVKNTFFPMLLDDYPGFSIYYNICLKIQLKNVKHLLLNILLTIPLGVSVQYIFDLTLKGRIFLSIIGASSIEVFQLIILITLKPIDMIFDINDIICNIFGAIIGIIISLIINKLIVLIPFEKKCDDLFTYMYKVGDNCNHQRSSLYEVDIKKYT